MSKYTPGPWTWIMEDPSCLALYGPKGLLDHVLWSRICPACAERGAKCTGPNDANAQLIAAAPDLLTACKEAEDLYWVDMQPSTVRKLREAIAKAEGG